jgi:hypothetical protein
MLDQRGHAPRPPPPLDFNQTSSGATLALSTLHALMLHLRSAPWLAKDVVWVAADASCGLVESVAAWVAEYQQTVGDRGFQRPARCRKDGDPGSSCGQAGTGAKANLRGLGPFDLRYELVRTRAAITPAAMCAHPPLPRSPRPATCARSRRAARSAALA